MDALSVLGVHSPAHSATPKPKVTKPSRHHRAGSLLKKQRRRKDDRNTRASPLSLSLSLWVRKLGGLGAHGLLHKGGEVRDTLASSRGRVPLAVMLTVRKDSSSGWPDEIPLLVSLNLATGMSAPGQLLVLLLLAGLGTTARTRQDGGPVGHETSTAASSSSCFRACPPPRGPVEGPLSALHVDSAPSLHCRPSLSGRRTFLALARIVRYWALSPWNSKFR